MNVAGGVASAAAVKVETAVAPAPITAITSLLDMQGALQQAGYMKLATEIYLYAHLVKLEEGRLEYRPANEASPDMAQELTRALKDATGKRWMVSVSTAVGQPTLLQQAKAAEEERSNLVRAHNLVKQVFEIFPDAELKKISKLED